MKKILWFCYASVTESGDLKAASWIVAAARHLIEAGDRLTVVAPDLGRTQIERKKTNCGCDVIFIPGRTADNRVVVEEMIRDIHQLLEEEKPNVFQIFGTEFSSYLCAGYAAKRANLSDRTVIWIQGLCGPIGQRYCDGLPKNVVHKWTLRDFLRQDNIYCQKQKFLQRAKNEEKLLRLVKYAIGRTQWDREQVKEIAPEIAYRHCNELLRQPFYENRWSLDTCERSRLFVCQSDYPIKGLHMLLQALPKILAQYPDTRVYISGESILKPKGFQEKLAQQSYAAYLRKLIKKNNLEKNLVFTGYLTAEEMVEQYQKAHVYVLPSMIENSPNSLAEAMLLGVPCVASRAGGIPSMLTSLEEGLLYDKTDADQLADAVIKLFGDDTLAQTMGAKARMRAEVTHDPKTGMEKLMTIYDEIGGQQNVSQ